MHVILLCGGSGSRMNDYSFPKPLNMIYGKPAIYYTLMNLPSSVTTIHFVVAPHLRKYNFQQIVINLFKTRKCIFHDLPYFTRGAAESAMIGTKDITDDMSPVMFLDNDVLYNFPPSLFETPPKSAFLGYAEDSSGSEAFSFLKIDSEGCVTDYKEKVRISNLYCCGVYGFESLHQFRKIVLEVLMNQTQSEVYMSTLYQLLLQRGITVKGQHFEKSTHIGTLTELRNDLYSIPKLLMRVCFDLDNTLVTYPEVPGNYSTVKPIDKMIHLARKLKKEGHTIIIHTARRMATHSGNVGAVIKDIGLQTFKTLEEFEIPFDELIFGKPIADIYIDDRAINPYRNDICSMGLIGYDEKEEPINMLSGNKYNTIFVNNEKVTKVGPLQFMKGELFYYLNLPTTYSISKFFPKYYHHKHLSENKIKIDLEYIKGIPFYTLFKYGLITNKHIDDLFLITDCLHNFICDGAPSSEKVYQNYYSKLVRRFEIKEDYPFEDASLLQKECLDGIASLEKDFDIRSMIHGDLWFSNIMIDFKNQLRIFDMKGQVDDLLTLGGDRYYDFGKLYQSFLGFDSILYNDTVDEIYVKEKYDYFLEKIKKFDVSYDRLKIITFSLVMGVFHSIHDIDAKNRVWIWIKQMRHECKL